MAAEPKDRILELRRVPAADLQADPRNFRRHPAVQRRALERMRERLGVVNAVIARETPDGLVLIDGHLRTDMAGAELVPVIVTDLSAEEAAEALATLDPIADMALADKAAVAVLLDEMETEDADLRAVLADLDPFKGLLRMAAQEAADAAVIPQVEPHTRVGDLYALGAHRLLCGDSTVAANVERLLDGASPRLLVTDPPYGVDYDPTWRVGKGFSNPDARMQPVTNDSDPRYWAAALLLVSSVEVAYVWSPSNDNLLVFGAVLQEAEFDIRATIIWRKQTFPISRGHYHWQHETLFYGVRRGKTGQWVGGRKQTTVWDITAPIGHAKTEAWGKHSTQKPMECMARPIRNHQGDVYDPFVGVGTTILAAGDEGRVCYAMEINPSFVDAAIARWEQHSGETASLIGRTDQDSGGGVAAVP